MTTGGDPQLSEQESQAADALRGLALDPAAASRARILAAVRASVPAPSVGVGGRVHRHRRILVGFIAGFAALGAAGSTAVVASADALPGGPGYALRSVNEHLRLVFAGATEKENLRVRFAERRIDQANQALRGGDRGLAATLLSDSRDYIHQAQTAITEVDQGQRGDVQQQLNTASADEQHSDGQLQQSGGSGSQDPGGSGHAPGTPASGGPDEQSTGNPAGTNGNEAQPSVSGGP